MHIYTYIYIYISLNNIDIFHLHFWYMSFRVATLILWYPAGIGKLKLP